MGFTKGPWRVEQGTTQIWGACDPDDKTTYGMGYPIACANIIPSGLWAKGPWADEGEANAYLMAAAPDLLAHLEFAVKLLKPWCGATTQVQAMEDAIAKAKGL